MTIKERFSFVTGPKVLRGLKVNGFLLVMGIIADQVFPSFVDRESFIIWRLVQYWFFGFIVILMAFAIDRARRILSGEKP